MATRPGPIGRERPHMRLLTPVPAASDAELVRAMREGARLSAGLVWDRYAGLVRRILRRSLGPSVDVEDAVQDAFMRLFRDIGKLRDPSALRSFLIGITLHVAQSELRKRRARRWLFLSETGQLPEREPLLDGSAQEQREALQRLYQVLDRMDAARRLVFVLRYVEGLELLELAKVLGCSLATTKRRVADAAERVKRLSTGDAVLIRYLGRER